MFRALIFMALAGYTSAASLSAGCRTALVSISLDPDAVACLAPKALVTALSGTSNKTLLKSIDGWMTSMCAAKPCSNGVIAAVVKNITTGCASDASISSAFLENIHNAQYVYPTVRKIMCSKDADTNCVTSTLANVQTFMGSASMTISNLSDSNFGTVVAATGSFIGKMEANAKPTTQRRSIRFGRRSVNETQTVQAAPTESANSTLTFSASMTCTNCIRSWAQIIQNDFPGSVDSMFPGLTGMCGINTTNTMAANGTKAAATGVLNNSATSLRGLFSGGKQYRPLLTALSVTVIVVSLS